jgi:hypothetical protein
MLHSIPNKIESHLALKHLSEIPPNFEIMDEIENFTPEWKIISEKELPYRLQNLVELLIDPYPFGKSFSPPRIILSKTGSDFMDWQLQSKKSPLNYQTMKTPVIG